MLLHEEIDRPTWDHLCTQALSKITLYPEMTAFIQKAIGKGLTVIVVTCGLGSIWQKVLEFLGPTVHIIGGKRLQDGYFVTPEVKQAVVRHLQMKHKKKVVALGDSEVDLKMLIAADDAYLVVGKEGERSTSIDACLGFAIGDDGLQTKQILLPDTVTPRLDTNVSPIVTLSNIELESATLDQPDPDPEPDLVNAITNHPEQSQPAIVNVEELNLSASRLFATAMRDSKVSGPELRKHHQAAGFYLAINYMTQILGLETVKISHVQGNEVDGYRFKDEEKTIIVAMMRGGEPMALGVNEAMPKAMFFHAKRPQDLKPEHIAKHKNLVLVDSVINTGQSIKDFIRYIRRDLDYQNPMVVVAGVIQADFATASIEYSENVTFLTLRMSDTKYKGTGSTDTGHRLFNSTHLP